MSLIFRLIRQESPLDRRTFLHRIYRVFRNDRDERNVVRVWTNYRKGEIVCLYRLVGISPDLRRNVFLIMCVTSHA